MNEIAIFPLNVVVFPEGELPLRLFEPRYLDMVKRCMRKDIGFGICLISKGNEAGVPAEINLFGTYVRIIDWEQLPGGLLGITVKGEKRFRIESSWLQDDNLRIADITYLDEDDDIIPENYQGFSELLKQIAERYELEIADEEERFEKATWVSERLAEILPFELSMKQTLLEMDKPLQRFDLMQALLEKVEAERV